MEMSEISPALFLPRKRKVRIINIVELGEKKKPSQGEGFWELNNPIYVMQYLSNQIPLSVPLGDLATVLGLEVE